MVLSQPAITRHLREGSILIDPFDPRQLNTSSYDVTLGPHYWREQEHLPHDPNIYNPYSEREVRRVWGAAPCQAQPVRELPPELQGLMADGIAPNDQVILLRPGETILGHTLEFIGGSSNRVTTMMKARSSMGRNFIEVCKCAGWGDIPYCNRWTMEITNNSRFYTIPLVVGRRIAQIVFFETEPVDGAQLYTKGGKYQDTLDLAQLKAQWTPTTMLPKMYRDYEVGSAPKGK